MAEKKKIIAVGANPAWQKVLQFASMRYNAVNRAERMWAFASGKGINFVRACHCWGVADAEVVQFAGGDNGKLLLDDLAKENLDCKTFPAAVPTRCCTTLLSLADGAMTEIIEPSQAPGREAESAALEYIKTAALQVDGGALCGQLPSGMSADFYVKCVEAFVQQGKTVLIDSYKNIADVLAVGKNALLKINAEEVQTLSGVDNVVEAVKMLLNAYPLTCIAITDGAEKAYLGSRNGFFELNVPAIKEVVNPVGSGDTVSAVFLSEYLAGTPAETAFAYGIAAASANCLSMKCGEYDRSTAEKLFNDICIKKL